MSTIDTLRNHIIDKLLAISDEEYLEALYQLIAKSPQGSNPVKLTKEQVLMLQLSDMDIENDRLISQEELDEKDREWLRSL